MKILPSPINICQYYHAHKSLVLKWSELLDVRNKSQTSMEQFEILWVKANATARVLLVCMWVLKDTIMPNAEVEITTANPNFHLTRFCIVVLIYITRHHKKFFTNLKNKKSLSHIEPYELEAIKDIQEAKNSQFLEFLSTLYTLVGEDTTLLHEANHLH